jgi:DNA-binding transcriptional ArsR family regulator
MLKSHEYLDKAFHALSDGTRRGILERLSQGPASVSELAKPYTSTLAAIQQHVQVLEASGLVVTTKHGRTRECRISSAAVLRVEHWLSERRQLWEHRFDQLGKLIEQDRNPVARKRPRSNKKGE